MADGIGYGKKIVVWSDEQPPDGHPPASMPATNEVRARKATVHIERISDNCITMEIEAGGQQIRCTFWTKRAALYFGAEAE